MGRASTTLRERKGKSIKSEVLLIEKKVGQYLDRIVSTDSPILINSYEGEVRNLEERKISLNEKVQNCGRPLQELSMKLFEPLLDSCQTLVNYGILIGWKIKDQC